MTSSDKWYLGLIFDLCVVKKYGYCKYQVKNMHPIWCLKEHRNHGTLSSVQVAARGDRRAVEAASLALLDKDAQVRHLPEWTWNSEILWTCTT